MQQEHPKQFEDRATLAVLYNTESDSNPQKPEI